jgi:hypothetical protein
MFKDKKTNVYQQMDILFSKHDAFSDGIEIDVDEFMNQLRCNELTEKEVTLITIYFVRQS